MIRAPDARAASRTAAVAPLRAWIRVHCRHSTSQAYATNPRNGVPVFEPHPLASDARLDVIAPFITPAMFREFVVPVYRRIVSERDR